MRNLKSSGLHTCAGMLAAIIAPVAMPSFAGAQSGFDIAVSGVVVHATQNHAPIMPPVETGQPGKEYYLNCGFTATGSGGPSAVQFRFLANGQVLRDVLAPVKPGEYVGMGEFWTPASAGAYTLVCDANHSQTASEGTYANNLKTRQFAVKTFQIGPAAAQAAPGLVSSQNGQISADVAKKLMVMPDIRVHGLEVHAVNPDNTLQPPTVVTKGVAGREYSLHCVMEPVGQVATSSVRFVFRVNGQIVRDVYAPVESGTPINMGAKWKAQTTGNYTLDCEANPQQTVAEGSYDNNLAQAVFPVGPPVTLQAIGAAPSRFPSGPPDRDEEEPEIIVCPECFNPQPEPPGKDEEEQPEEIILCPECFNPQPEPPGDPPPEGFIPDPEPPGETVPLAGKAETPSVGAPDLLPELKLQGNGVLFPLKIRVKNQGAAPAMASRTRVTWYLTCQRPDGTSAQTFPVGPQDKVYSVPAIAANQSYDVPLTGPKQYCEAPRAAQNLVCAEECYVRALADTDRLVPESDEINNAAAAAVKRK
ncbi:MAG: CARDB domain-containing protein [Gemmatimonadota bacterium]